MSDFEVPSGQLAEALSQLQNRRSGWHEITGILSSARMLDEVAPEVLEVVLRTYGWDFADFWVLHPSLEVLQRVSFAAAPGVKAPELEAITRSLWLGIDSGVPGKVWSTGKPVWISDLNTIDFPRCRAAVRAGFVSVFGCPMRFGSRVSGALTLFSRNPEQPSQESLTSIELLCRLLGQFVERERAESALRVRVRLAEASARVTNALAQGGPLEATLAECAAALQEGFDASCVAIWSADAGCKGLRSWVSTPGCAEACAGAGELLSMSAAEASRGVVVSLRIDESCPHIAALPFYVEDRFLGGITLQSAGEINATAAQTLVSVGDSLAVGIHRKRVEEELRRSQELLAQASKMEAVGRLAGGIAHDFNNILTAILGNAEFALEALDPASQTYKDVNAIREAGRRASTLTRQLLVFSRKHAVKPQMIDLNQIVRETHGMLRHVIGEDIELGIVTGPDPLRVLADPSHISQALVNLAVNSRDAMPRGGRLSIEVGLADLDAAWANAHPGSKPGKHAALTVNDTGCGMSAEVASHAFEPFFTTKEKGKGTGLGLAAVYGVVQQSGGSIALRTEPGAGTTITLYLPLPALQPTEETQIVGVESGQGGVVLLVDDEPEVRRIARHALEASGFVVLESLDPQDAIRLATGARSGIDLLLTDVVMPGMSGPELARSLASLLPEMRVVFMSGYADDALGNHGLESDRVVLVEKPFTSSALVRAVRQVLASARGQPAS